MEYFNAKEEKIAKMLDSKAGSEEWQDWKWQLKHSVKDIDTFEKLTGILFTRRERWAIMETLSKFPLSITPYYLSCINTKNYQNDPIYKQSFPDPRELRIQPWEMEDPLAEEDDSPVPGITHRYPNRVLFHVSNVCSMYCRHCTRKRKVGDVDSIPNRAEMEKGIDYIRENTVVRDVLLSGGDPFLLSDETLDWLLGELRAIPHVEVIRIGTRTPVVLPFRITDNLVKIINKHHPVWINTHFNHPLEMTPSAKRAVRKLADGGIPLGNQSVLLAGVNDCLLIIKELMHQLVKNRVRPYYLYQCDLSEGLSHFRTPVGKGIEIMEGLIGHTSGFAVPTYVIDAPGGGGKIPVMPNYILSWSSNKVVLRNYEGVITTYQEPEDYQTASCDRNCADCHLHVTNEQNPDIVGVGKLLANWDQATSLIPDDNQRMERRSAEAE